MKIIFMGTPDFAIPSLRKLILEHDVLAVITQPDKPRGRGKKIQFTPVKSLALEHGIEVLQPNKIRDKEFIEKLQQYNADIFVVVAYGQILPESVLNIPKYGCINVHGSLLPKYRGAAPIQMAIINGEKETGVTIMKLDNGVDTGDTLLSKKLPILPTDTFVEVHDKMSLLGAEALIESLDLIGNGSANYQKQDDSLSSHAKLITKDMGKINWSSNSENIINLIRGINPAYTTYNGDLLKVWNAESINGYENGDYGEIVDNLKNKGLVVKTGDSAIVLTEIQGKGSKKMKASDYLRGHKMDIGIILGA